MLYFNPMENLDYWEKWAQTLQQRHLSGVVLTLLEGVDPLKMVISQTLLGASVLMDNEKRTSLRTFAETLEDPLASRSFASFLRTGKF
jgi:hypothetical protein